MHRYAPEKQQHRECSIDRPTVHPRSPGLEPEGQRTDAGILFLGLALPHTAYPTQSERKRARNFAYEPRQKNSGETSRAGAEALRPSVPSLQSAKAESLGLH
jgi:hypothetical protein